MNYKNYKIIMIMLEKKTTHRQKTTNKDKSEKC